MNQEDIKNLFDDKYQNLLGVTYEEWLEQGPQTEEEAYARMQEIDDELKTTEDEYTEATGMEKEELSDFRERLRNEYALVETVYGLESQDE